MYWESSVTCPRSSAPATTKRDWPSSTVETPRRIIDGGNDMAMCPRLRTRPIGIGRSTTTRSDECSDPGRTSPSLYAPNRLHAGRNQAFVARAMALVHVPSLTFGWLVTTRRGLSEGASVCYVASYRRRALEHRPQRHGGERRHLLGTPPESSSRQARPSEPMKTLGANGLAAPRTGPSNGSSGRRSRRSRGSC